MALSPAHKFGQIIGEVLEAAILGYKANPLYGEGS